MEEEKTGVKTLCGVKLNKIYGRTITVAEKVGNGCKINQFVLSDNSLKKPRELLKYLTEIVDITLVNNKIQDVTRHQPTQ